MTWLVQSARVACASIALCLSIPLSTQAQEEAAAERVEGEAAIEEADDVELEPSKSLRDKVTTANNPLARLRAVQIHNYFAPKLNGIPDESANTLFLRLIAPFWRIVPRLTIPFVVRPAPEPTDTVAKVTGIGDLTIFFAFVVTPMKSKGIFGIGPLYTAPTASNPAIGQDQHQVGAAAIGLWSEGILLVGGLLNYRIGVAGDPMRPRAQSIAVQPAMYIQIGQGFYLRSVPIWFFDLERPNYNVPFGLGVGKVIRTDKVVYNFFVEPQFSVAIRGIGQPPILIYMGLNMQIGSREKKKRNRAELFMNQLRAAHAGFRSW